MKLSNTTFPPAFDATWVINSTTAARRLTATSGLDNFKKTPVPRQTFAQVPQTGGQATCAPGAAQRGPPNCSTST